MAKKSNTEKLEEIEVSTEQSVDTPIETEKKKKEVKEFSFTSEDEIVDICIKENANCTTVGICKEIINFDDKGHATVKVKDALFFKKIYDKIKIEKHKE